MTIFVVWYVPIGLEPVQAFFRIAVVRQLPPTATVLLSPATLAVFTVRLVFCCCNKKNTLLTWYRNYEFIIRVNSCGLY